MKYNKTSRKGDILIKGISRRKRESFKRAFKPYLKEKGISIGDFDRIILLKAMKNPAKFVG